MSVIGTGVAAGVAQAASNAETVARKRDKRTNKDAEETRRIREIFESHLKTLEEHDEGEQTARIYTDSQVPQHEHNQDPVPEKQRREASESSDPGQDRPRTKRQRAASAYAAADPHTQAPGPQAFDLAVDPDTGHATARLFSHLDVTA